MRDHLTGSGGLWLGVQVFLTPCRAYPNGKCAIYKLALVLPVSYISVKLDLKMVKWGRQSELG